MFNKLLNDTEREVYRDVISELHLYCPETIKNKVPQANVQQAFVLDTVRKFSNYETSILCVGAYEDTAAETLRKCGYNILEIDPLDSIWNPTNYGHILKSDLKSFYTNNRGGGYDVIFSTSVIEHVEDDDLFIDQVCKLLNVGGYGILTCDFNNDYKPGDRKPVVDYRLYTVGDFLSRFSKILHDNNCVIFGPYNWEGNPDFDNGQAVYSFATFVFQKIIN